MPEEITIIIDGITTGVPAGATILQAAPRFGHRDPQRVPARGHQRQGDLPNLRSGGRRIARAGGFLRGGSAPRHGGAHTQRARRAKSPHHPGDAGIRGGPIRGAGDQRHDGGIPGRSGAIPGEPGAQPAGSGRQPDVRARL